ncbi:MAG: NAD(P)H-hydrate dehydratase [Candidatus Micrarchaeia archaeon]
MQNLKEFAKSLIPNELSAEEMKAVELNCVAMGISSVQLMENAGSAVASVIKSKFKGSRSILFFCGTGGNGGDGFAAARMLSSEYDVNIIVLGAKGSIKSGAALSNFNAVSNSPFVKLYYYIEMDGNEVDSLLSKSDVVVDAIFGTGFEGELKGIYKEAVLKINNSGKHVISIDIPSGFSQQGFKLTINAEYTVILHKMKLNMELCKGVGKAIVADIGIPLDAEAFTGPGDLFIGSKPRSDFASKKDLGRLVIIGGSSTYHSAPKHAMLAAYNTLSSLRVGAGYAVTFVPKHVLNAVRAQSPNLIVRPLGSSSIAFTNELKSEIDKSTAVAIGMGIGTNPDAQVAALKTIKYALSKGKKVVVDADGIKALANAGIDRSACKNIVVTPHDKEFFALTGISLEHESKDSMLDRAVAAFNAAKKLGMTILLKGHNTIITNGQSLKINLSHASDLATMGSGDVLTGIIGGYAARGASPFEAACAGAYLHSQVGELLAIEKGNHIIASDIASAIPKILINFDRRAK